MGGQYFLGFLHYQFDSLLPEGGTNRRRNEKKKEGIGCGRNSRRKG
jgi:hypothetical protein